MEYRHSDIDNTSSVNRPLSSHARSSPVVADPPPAGGYRSGEELFPGEEEILADRGEILQCKLQEYNVP